MCSAENRRCKSSRVTSTLGVQQRQRNSTKSMRRHARAVRAE